MKILTMTALCLAATTACSTTVSQTKVAMAGDGDRVARQDALNVLPHAVCKKYEECEHFGEGKKYASMQDCEAAEGLKWAKAWPEESCGKKGVIAGKLKECEQRATTWACGNNVLDFGGLLTECNAMQVCK